MKNFIKIIFISVFSLIISFSYSYASSGVFKVSHDLGFGKDTNLDPITKGRLFQVIEKTMNRLVRNDLNGVPSPSLATSWSANPDASEWTFNLRKGVKFHDGSDFDAEDVKFSLMRVSANKSPAAKGISMIESVEVVDSHTVKMKLSTSFADLPLNLTDYRLRMLPSGSEDTIAKTGIGTGPFMVDKFDAEGTTILKANPDYWEGAPGVAEVHIIAISDSQARVQALLSGQIDMLRVIDYKQKPIFEGNSKFKHHVIPTGNWRGMVMRTDLEPFKDARVRKAVRMAVDRQALADLVTGGAAEVTCDHPVMKSDQYRADLSCPQDIEGAKKLLADAGYPDGIEFTVYPSSLEPTWTPIAEVVQQQVAAAGIKVNIQVVPSDGYWNDIWLKKPVAMTRWNQRPADQALNEIYHSSAKWNESLYKNAAFDSLLGMARKELDFEKRKAMYQAAQNVLWEESGTLIPYTVSKLIVTTARVNNLDEVENWSVRWHKITVD
jgi:peptide/nickel transport system substrate-binding protein